MLLAESFGRETWWLWRNRATMARPAQVTPAVARTTLTVAAAALVWFTLVAPTHLDDFTLGGFVRLPIEALVVVVLCMYLPVLAARIVALSAGLVLGLLTILKILDLGFYDGLDRPFSPVSDWSYLGPAVGVLRDSVGSGRALAAEIGIVLTTAVILLVLPLSMLRVTRAASRQRARSTRAIVALGGVWLLVAALGVRTSTGTPVASAGAAGLAYDQVHQVRTGLADQKKFAASISAPDPYAITPGNSLLTGLRGKDVIFAFVESYGQVAVQDSSFSAPVDAVLNAGTRQLDAAGYASRSAFLTSPTFGGISWLAHSTLQTGLWIDNQQRYDQVVSSSRFTLSDAFKRAGWRTVGDVPSNKDPWPQGTSFYHYDQLYDEHNVGYQGPKFSYASMPDQYTLSAFQNRELAPGHQPVMAEIDLVSSHTPWTPLPHMVGWDQVGNGSIYDPMPAQGRSPADVWRSAAEVRDLYGRSVQYSLTSLISFVQHVDDPNLVLVMLGDHQPATIVSGSDATHDVPITIVAHDPQVMDSISSWGWQEGLLPSPQAPVWSMDAFRNRFLTAFQSPSR